MSDETLYLVALGSTNEVSVNFCIGIEAPANFDEKTLSAQDKHGLERAEDFGVFGNAYAKEHGTRPATVGLVLSSSPIALLAW